MVDFALKIVEDGLRFVAARLWLSLVVDVGDDGGFDGSRDIGVWFYIGMF